MLRLGQNDMEVDANLQLWEDLEVYAFPPFAIRSQDISKVSQLNNCRLTLMHASWFLDLLSLIGHGLEGPASKERLEMTTTKQNSI